MRPYFSCTCEVFLSKLSALLSIVGIAISGLGAMPDAEAASSLAEAYKQHFLIGAAITPGQVLVPATRKLIAREFNIAVAENAMKPESLNREGPGQYNFENADRIVDFARSRHIKMRGHTLVWHQQAATWMFAGDGPEGYPSKEALTERLRTYIHDVVTRFKGRVYAWDVVNEAFAPDENVPQENGWRQTVWYRVLGPEYIELAFKFAHEADPDALLFYNDYNTESPRKHAMILALIKQLQAKNIPIHGIGHQSHYTIAQPRDFSLLEQHIEEIGNLGLTNHITELDISLNRNLMRAEIDEASPALLQEQARRYENFFAMALRQKNYVSAVVMWGLNDEVSWLRSWPIARFDAPLLFNEANKRKPAYRAVIKAAAQN